MNRQEAETLALHINRVAGDRYEARAIRVAPDDVWVAVRDCLAEKGEPQPPPVSSVLPYVSRLWRDPRHSHQPLLELLEGWLAEQHDDPDAYLYALRQMRLESEQGHFWL